MWRRWIAAVSVTEPGTTLALFRMAIGACLLLTVGWPWFGGVVDAIWVAQGQGGIHQVRGTALVHWLGGPTLAVIHGLVYANLVAGVLLILGLGGRLTAFVALQLAIGLLQVNAFAGAAYDLLLTNGLWLCVLGSSTQTLSLDARLRTGSWVDPTPIGRWSRYLVVFQLAVLYATTGLQKLSIHWVPWGDLQALYYILRMPNFHYRDLDWLGFLEPLLQLSTLVTWLWEVCGGVFLIATWRSDHGSTRWRRVRTLWVALGLVMHLVLLVTMDLGPFGFTTLAFYVALYSPQELESAWTALSLRASAGRPPDRPAPSG